MNNKTKKALKKKLFIAGLFLLSAGTIVSVSLSQISFATNSFDNNIKMLADNNTLEQNTNNITPRTAQLNNEMIGKRVNGFSPFWKSANWNTKNNYWKTSLNYQYFKANVDPALDNQFWTNPGIAFAWYGNDHTYTKEERPFPSHTAAGPGQITFYTRAMEDFYYGYQQKIDNILLNNQQFIGNYKSIFFNDISNVEPDLFVRFINSIISKDTGYGTNDLNQKPFQSNGNGSILSHLLFNDHLGYQGDEKGPNINLNKIVFYPSSYYFDSKDYKYSWVKSDVLVSAPYNTVWMGNEYGQEATGREYFDEKVNPVVDYNAEKNSALMRAMTIDSLTLRTWQNGYKGKIWEYQATGAIKFRIFYEYDFIRSPQTRDFTYDINDLKDNKGVDLENYLIYDDLNSSDASKKVNTENIKYLIANNYQTMMKNICYENVNNDGMNTTNGKPINEQMMLPPFVSLDPAKITIGDDATFSIDPNNPNESSITFTVTIDVSPKLTRQLTIKFHSRAETRVKSDTIRLNNVADVITATVDEASAIKVIQNNLNQIFTNSTFTNGTTAKVIKIGGYDNVSGASEGTIYFKSITLKPVLILGQQVNQEKEFTLDSTQQQNFKITGYKQTNELSTSIQNNISLVNTPEVNWSTVLAETLMVDNPRKQIYLDALKTYLVTNKLIQNPSWSNKAITVNDFNLEVISVNNTTASAQVKVTLLNYYHNGSFVNNKTMDIFTNIDGFKQLNATSPKQDLVFNIETDTTVEDEIRYKPVNLVNEADINKFIESKPTSEFINFPIDFQENTSEKINNPWVQNTQIRIDPEKKWSIDEDVGSIRVFAQASWYQTVDKGIEKEFKSLFEFTIQGFETNQEKLTTFITDKGTLPGVDKILPDQVTIKNETVKQAIIDSGLIKNLYPLAEPLTIDDISLNNLNPINKDGSLTCNVTINNFKAIENGAVQEFKTFTGLTFFGFKIQNPTSINTADVDLTSLGLLDMNLNDIQNVFIETIEPTLQQNLSLIIANQFPNSIVSFEYIPTSIDFEKSTLDVKVSITDGIYDQNGNSNPTGQLGPVVVKLTGFYKDALNTTSLNNTMTLIGWESRVASIETTNPEIITAIKDLVVSNNNIINPNPAQVAVATDVVSVVINSYDNLTGSLFTTIELNKNICLYNGTVSKANLKQDVVINGLKHLQETKVSSDPYLDIDNKYGIRSIIPSEINNNPKLIEDIKRAIAGESHQFFSNLVFDENLKISNIYLVYKSYNNLNGTALFDITITGGFACDALGILKDITFYDINIHGFKQLQTIATDGNLTVPFDTVSPSDFMTDQQSAIDTIKKILIEQKLSPNMFVGGFPTNNDIIVTVIQVDDKNGQIFIRVEIRNQNYVPPILPQTNKENLTGEIVQWNPNDPNPFILEAVTINGFKYDNNKSKDDWWIITASTVGSVIGTTLIVLLILFILRRFVF